MKQFKVDEILYFEYDSGDVSVCIDYGPGESYGGCHTIKREKIPELIAFLQAAYGQSTP